MSLLDRVLRSLTRLGEQFTVGGNTYYGVFKILDSGTMRNYLNDTEIMGVVKPGLLLFTKSTAVINNSDIINHGGRDYTVMRSSVHKVGAVSAVKLVILG